MNGARRERSKTPELNIGSVVAAFSEEQIERIVGLSKGRLRYWARTAFFSPSFIGSDDRLPFSRFYSFKDVVALRTLEILRVREGVPLQHLRKVAENLSHLKDDLWTKTTLHVVNKTVVASDPEIGPPREVVSGQYVLDIPLSKIIADTRADIVAFRRRPKGTEGRVSRSRAIARNAWVVSGTRIPVASIVRLAEDGYDAKQIIAEYPDLTHEDVKAALNHGNQAAA